MTDMVNTTSIYPMVSTDATLPLSYYYPSYTRCPNCGYCSCCGRDDKAHGTSTYGGGGYVNGKCHKCGYCGHCGRK